MTNGIFLTIDLKKHRLRVHRQALRALHNPPFVELLFSTRQNAIVMLSRYVQLPGGQEIAVSQTQKSFDISCKELISRITQTFTGLNTNETYRLKGVLVTEEDERNGIFFPLNTLTKAETDHE